MLIGASSPFAAWRPGEGGATGGIAATTLAVVLAPLLGAAVMIVQLAWEASHGGIQSHHLLARADLPAVSNLWGLATLPALGWLAAHFVRRDLRQFDGTVAAVSAVEGQIETPSGMRFAGRVAGSLAPGAKATLSIRPEQIELARVARAGAEPVTVINRIFLGEHTEYLVRHASLGDLLVRVARQAETAQGSFAPNTPAHIAWSPDAALILAQD